MKISKLTTKELEKKYPKAGYAYRDEIGCPMSCPTCMYCTCGVDDHDDGHPGFCTASRRI